MRILHLCDSINPSGLGGYESYLHHLSAQLASADHESIVTTQSPTRNSPERLEREHYMLCHLKGNLLEARKWEYYAMSEAVRNAAASELFKVNDVAENALLLAKELEDLIENWKPDIIHAHSTYVVFNRVLAKLKTDSALDIPSIVTIHGLPKPLVLPGGKETTDYDELVSAFPFKLALGVSKTVSQALREYLKPLGLEHLVRTEYLGVDMSLFKPRPNLEKRWDVAFMGRLEEMKSVDLFPKMLALLKLTHPDLKMILTGDGSLKMRLLEDIEHLGVGSLVEYRGVVEAEKIPELINQSRVFLYPSRREPFGLSIVEAMACGVPVVTTDVFGPSEIVRHKWDGYVVPVDDVHALAEAIETLLLDANLRLKLGRNAMNSVKKRFDIRLHAKRLTGIYREVLPW
ncbi:MAG: glycosyltransferase family 1 protein [Candidatus Thorarchaeota archaeon]|nr:glycosyltransferase family 1 protein [Candidatus Thorarchaeota archaeon]